MPYVNIKITRTGATAEQKAELIKGATELLQRVLNKNPATTFVIIEEVETHARDQKGPRAVSVHAQTIPGGGRRLRGEL